MVQAKCTGLCTKTVHLAWTTLYFGRTLIFWLMDGFDKFCLYLETWCPPIKVEHLNVIGINFS